MRRIFLRRIFNSKISCNNICSIEKKRRNRMLIQIIEDDRALSEGIALALKEPSLDFVQSMTVQAAKEAFEKCMPELLILDVNLPDGSGYEYLRWVR